MDPEGYGGATCRSAADCPGIGNYCGLLSPTATVSGTGCPETLTVGPGAGVTEEFGFYCKAGSGSAPETQICEVDADCQNLHPCKAVTITRNGTTLNFGLCL